MQIAVISGSHRIGNQSIKIANFIKGQLEQWSEINKTVLLDVAAYDFPVMDERLGYLETPHPGPVSVIVHAHKSTMFLTMLTGLCV